MSDAEKPPTPPADDAPPAADAPAEADKPAADADKPAEDADAPPADAEVKPADGDAAATGDAAKADDKPAAEDKPTEDKPAEDKPAEGGDAPAAANDDDELKRLEAELAEIEREAEAKEAEAAELEKKCEGAATTDDLKAEHAELQKQQQSTTADVDAVNEKIAAQQAEYDRVMANKDLLERRDACKADIADTESKLAAQQEIVQQLEQDLDVAQSKYKEMRDRRAAFVKQVTEVLNALKEQVERKIAETIDSDEVKSLNAFELLQLLSDLVDARERELSNNARLLREVEAAIVLKRDLAERLESESTTAVGEKKRERAETVKRLIYGFQEERNALQADIEEVRRVNNEQASNLRVGHVSRTARDPTVFKAERESLTPSGRRKPLKRVTAVKPDLEPTPEEQLILDKNAEVERELNETMSQVSDAVHQKTALTKQQKSLHIQRKAESAEASARVNELEAQVVSEVERVRKLNVENARLADAVKHLTDLVRVTKDQVERIRGHTAPLPIEED